MPKSFRTIALLLATAFLSVSVVPAMAGSASVVISNENDSRYGNENDAPQPAQVTKRSRDSIALPPVVIKPSTSNQNMAPANVPVELGTVQPAKKTPADVFVESATVGVGAMAVGAVALGAVAVTRGARARREKNAEYLYSSDN